MSKAKGCFRLALGAACLAATAGPLFAQEMASPSFRIRTHAADMGGSDVSPLEMGVASAGFKSVYAVGLNVVDTPPDTSAGFELREGYIYTLNAPPRKLADALRLPENTSFIFSNILDVGVFNRGEDGAGSPLPSDPDGSGERIHYHVQFWDRDPGDPAAALVTELNSRADPSAWAVSSGGPPSPFAPFPLLGLSGTSTTDYAKATVSLADGNYFWRMRATDGFFDAGAWSNVFFFAVDPPQPILTSPPDGAVITASAPLLDWNDVAGLAPADRYQVQIATDSAFASVVRDTQPGAAALPDPPDDANPAASTWTVVPALADGTYFWRVRVVNGLGNPIGPFSNFSRFQVTSTAVASVDLQPASADVPGGTVVTLRVELRSGTGAIVPPTTSAGGAAFSNDVSFAVVAGTGTLGPRDGAGVLTPLFVSDHIEVTYTTAIAAETAVIRGTVVRPGAPPGLSDDATIRGVGAFAVTAGPLNPAARSAPAGSTGVSILQFQLAAGGENVRVNSIAFSAGTVGTGNDRTHIPQVTLAEDVNGSGDLEPGTDRIIASGVQYSADNGTTTFGGLAETVSVGIAKTWLVAYDVDAAAPVGGTFAILLDPAAQVSATGISSANPITAGGSPFGGGPLTVTSAPTVGSLTLNEGTNNPENTNQLAAAQKVELAQIRLSTGAVEDVRVTSLSVVARGTGNDLADVGTVTLYRDVNENGQFDAGTDTGLASATAPAFAADNGARTFTGLSAVIPRGSAQSWLVVYDFSGSAAAGTTFQAQVDRASITAVGVTSGAAIASGGLTSVAGGTVTVVPPGTPGSLFLLNGPQNPGSQTITSSAQNIVMQQFGLAASSVEDALVTSIRVTASGTGNDFGDVSRVRLVEDVNGDGLFQSGFDVDLGPAGQTLIFSGNDGTVTFGGIFTTVAAGGYRFYLLIYDYRGTSAPGVNYRACIGANGDVAATGATTGTALSPAGAPVCGGVAQVGGAGTSGDLLVRLGPNNPPASGQLNGALDVEMLQVEMVATDFESVLVTAVAFTGTSPAPGSEVAHLLGASLVEDVDANGTFDPAADRTVAPNAAFLTDDGKVSYTGLTELIPAGSARRYILVYDFNGTAPVGSSFRGRIAASADISASGATSGLAITPFGLPVDGNAVAITSSGSVGSLSIALGPRTPAAQFVALNASLVPVLQFSLTAASVESVRIASLTLFSDGTGDDAADLSGITLLEDVNRNGQVDVGTDRILGPVSVSYGGDNGSATFAFAGSGEIVAGGQSEDWLLVYNFSGSAANGATFRALLNPAVDVAAAGLGSGAAITPSGSQITSATFATGTVGFGGVRGSLSVASGPFPLLAQEVPAFAHGVPVLQFLLRAGSIETIEVRRLEFGSGGSGSEVSDVGSAMLVLDANADGLFDDGTERVIAQIPTPFAADNGSLVFSGLSERIPANGQAVWLLVYDFSGLGATGGTFQATLVPDRDIVLAGAQSALPIIPSGPSQTGRVVTLRPVAGSEGSKGGPCFAGAHGSGLFAAIALGVWLILFSLARGASEKRDCKFSVFI